MTRGNPDSQLKNIKKQIYLNKSRKYLGSSLTLSRQLFKVSYLPPICKLGSESTLLWPWLSVANKIPDSSKVSLRAHNRNAISGKRPLPSFSVYKKGRSVFWNFFSFWWFSNDFQSFEKSHGAIAPPGNTYAFGWNGKKYILTKNITQQLFQLICLSSELTIEILHKNVKYVQSWQ